MKCKRRIGVHTSIAGGISLSLQRAHELGCKTIQIFSHNPRTWNLKQIEPVEVVRFKEWRSKFDISPVFIHASYLINIASGNQELRDKSITLLSLELDIADQIGAEYVILHPGSSSGEDKDISLKRAIASLTEVSKIKRWKTKILIENTSGKSGDISSSFNDISKIIASLPEYLIGGICLDTCHAFTAGYDISTEAAIKKTVYELKKYTGLNMIKLIHLNDSKGNAGSGLDRHEHIGLGKIGIKGLETFINHPSFRYIPIILETPKKKPGDDPENIAKVLNMINRQQ